MHILSCLLSSLSSFTCQSDISIGIINKFLCIVHKKVQCPPEVTFQNGLPTTITASIATMSTIAFTCTRQRHVSCSTDHSSSHTGFVANCSGTSMKIAVNVFASSFGSKPSTFSLSPMLRMRRFAFSKLLYISLLVFLTLLVDAPDTKANGFVFHDSKVIQLFAKQKNKKVEHTPHSLHTLFYIISLLTLIDCFSLGWWKHHCLAHKILKDKPHQ